MFHIYSVWIIINKSIIFYEYITMPLLKREQFAPITNSEYLKLLAVADDPLSIDQKNHLIAFAYAFFYATKKDNPSDISFEGITIHPDKILNVLTRQSPYDRLTDAQIRGIARACDALPYSPISLGETHSFELFFDALSNPTLHAKTLGIETSPYTQAYAAKILMTTVFNAALYVADSENAYIGTTNPYGNSYSRYKHELCGQSLLHNQTASTISSKHALLMKGDPVQHIDKGNTNPTPLDFLLANTHFTTGRWNKVTKYMTQRDQNGIDPYADQWVEQDREQARSIIKTELTRLYEHPELHHVIAAFGELSKQQTKYLLFSSNPLNVGGLGKIHNTGINHEGFYDHTDSIVSAGIIYPDDQRVEKNHLGTIVHEALHLIFDNLVGRSSSPVATPEDTAALDRAILADQEHRKTLNHSTLNPDEASVWNTVVNDLENTRSYFSGCSTHEAKQHIMRIEIIVRPMERLATGCSEEAIEKVMPHVWAFYRQNCRPMIENYLRQRGHQDRVISPPQAKQAILVSTREVPNANAIKKARHEPEIHQTQRVNPIKKSHHERQTYQEHYASPIAAIPTKTAPTQTHTLNPLTAQLTLHQTQFNLLLTQIDLLTQEKELASIQAPLLDFHRNLLNYQSTFFSDPKGDAFDTFKTKCKREITTLEAKLPTQSSVWTDRVYPIIKQILGVILAIGASLISCGIFPLVMALNPTAQKTYHDAFFKEARAITVNRTLKKIDQSLDVIEDIVKKSSP